MDNDTVGPMIAVIFMVVLYGGMFLFMIAAMVLWIVALVDAVKREFKEPNEKIMWVLVIALTHWIGALIYMGIGKKTGWLPGEAHVPPPGSQVPPSSGETPS